MKEYSPSRHRLASLLGYPVTAPLEGPAEEEIRRLRDRVVTAERKIDSLAEKLERAIVVSTDHEGAYWLEVTKVENLRAELAAMTERAKQAEASIVKMTDEFRAMESSWEAMQAKIAETERRQWDAEDALTAERERTKRRTEQLEICRREVLRLTRAVNERKDESK